MAITFSLSVMNDHAVGNDVYPPAHTYNAFIHTLPTCVTKSEISTHTHLSSILSCCQGSQRTFFSTSFFPSMNEWRASASLHPNPLPTGNRAAHAYKHTANRLPRGSGGGLWRIGHLYYITGLQEQRARKRKSEWRASPPHSLSLNFSSMSQRQSDSLDALRKRSMTSPRS